MAAFIMLIPLAVTSTKGWVKRLGGKKWMRLHRLTYVAAILGVIHFWMIVKSDIFYPALFGIVLAGLLVYRLMPKAKPAVRISEN
jgi:sulfoxide reductase heme-binding subunit YedZ